MKEFLSKHGVHVVVVAVLAALAWWSGALESCTTQVSDVITTSQPSSPAPSTVGTPYGTTESALTATSTPALQPSDESVNAVLEEEPYITTPENFNQSDDAPESE